MVLVGDNISRPRSKPAAACSPNSAPICPGHNTFPRYGACATQTSAPRHSPCVTAARHRSAGRCAGMTPTTASVAGMPSPWPPTRWPPTPIAPQIAAGVPGQPQMRSVPSQPARGSGITGAVRPPRMTARTDVGRGRLIFLTGPATVDRAVSSVPERGVPSVYTLTLTRSARTLGDTVEGTVHAPGEEHVPDRHG